MRSRRQGTLAKTLGALFVVTNLWLCKVFLPMNALMEEHWTNKKNNPAMVNKGDVTPFCAMIVIESVCWLARRAASSTSARSRWSEPSPAAQLHHGRPASPALPPAIVRALLFKK